MLGGLPGKGHRRAQRRTGTGIGGQDRRGTVTDGIQPRDRHSVLAQHLRVGVGRETAVGAEVAWLDPHRVVRRLGDLRETGVRLHGRVGVIPIVLGVAAPELEILAGARVFVHRRDGRLQADGIDACRLRQPAHRIRLRQKARAEIFTRDLLVGHELRREQRPNEIAAAEACVEHVPGRRLRVLGCVTPEELQQIRQVVLRLVRDALAASIDDAATRIGLVHDRKPRHGLSRHHHRGAPPGTIHQPRGGTHRDPGADRIARVGARRGAPGRVGWRRQIALAHLLVVLEPARGEHHAVSRPYRPGRAVALDARTGDAAPAIGQELAHRRRQPERKSAVLHRPAQPCDTGRPAGEPPRPLVRERPRQVAVVVPHHARRQLLPARRLHHQIVRLDLRHRDAIHHEDHVVRVAESRSVGAQHVSVHRHRLHRPVPALRTRQKGPVVRVVFERLVSHVRSLVQEVDHLRAFPEIGLDHRVGDGALRNGAPQVLACLVVAVLRPGRQRVAVAGQPDATAGSGARATVELALLDDQHVLQPELVRAQRGREPAVARAHHQHVDRQFAFAHRSPPLPRPTPRPAPVTSAPSPSS